MVSENSKELVAETQVPLFISYEEKQQNKPPPPSKWKRYWGILLTIVAALMFSLSILIIKILNFHPFNLGVWRFLVMLIFPIGFIIYETCHKKNNIFNQISGCNSTLVYLIIQAIVGSNALVLLFFAVQRLQLADTLVISNSTPVFVTLLAWVFLGETLGFIPILSAVMTLFGVAVICRPPILTGAASYDENLMYGVMLAFGCMLCMATSFVVIRYIRTVHHALVNLCFCLCGFIESLIIAYVTDVLRLPETLNQVLFILASAILAFSAQTCITLALKYEQAGPVSLVRTTELIFAFVWQLIFLGVVPDLFSLIGAAIIISAVVLTASRKTIATLPEDHKYRKTFRFLLV